MMKTLRFMTRAAVCLGLAVLSGAQTSKAVPKLIGQADLDCSLFLMGAPPQVRISAPYIPGQKMILTDSDLFYADPVSGADPFQPDSLWTILEWGSAVKGSTPPSVLGYVAYLRGRARVDRVEFGRAVMRIEKACGLIQAGQFLVPYQKGEVLVGTEQKYRVPFQSAGAPTGRVVFMEREAMQLAARGHWAVVDFGEEQGLEIGRQLTVFHREGKQNHVAVANAIVVWMGPRWATIKILDADDAVRIGDWVQTKSKG